MSEYAGMQSTHIKRRGKIRRCEWCGQKIIIGEKYRKWLWFDGGERSTVYAHDECAAVWQVDDYPCQDYERPQKRRTKND